MNHVPPTKKQSPRGPGPEHPDLPVFDGEIVGTEYGGGTNAQGEHVTSVIQMPSMLTRALMEMSLKADLPCAPSQWVIDGLHPSGVNMLSREHRISAADGREYVRGYLQLRLSDDDDGSRPYCMWIDVDLAFFGKLLEAASHVGEKPGRGPSVPLGFEGVPHVGVAPRWAGSHAFANVYARTAEITAIQRIQGGQQELPTRQVMATSEVALLSDAHVLVVPPEQVAVLPEWENPQEVFDYVEEAQLPFEPLFLDFTGPGGIGPTISLFDARIEMKGALIWRQASEQGYALVVAPYGGMELAVSGVGRNAAFLPARGYAPTEWESPGWFAFGEPPTDTRDGTFVPAGEVKLGMRDSPHYGMAATVSADACANTDIDDPSRLPGYAICPFSITGVRKLMLAVDDDADEWGEHLARWGMLVWTLATKALAALSITEAVEVEIVDAAMEKRDRKRADKRGWPIAQQVVIRSHQKRYRNAAVPSGEEAHYSHRFWRRATVAHYPLGTRMADTRPDLVTPCGREPERNCGFCRKVKRPACIVGPPDKPLMLKTLVRGKS